jgi:nucleoside-diphosphate-sugar epimerase
LSSLAGKTCIVLGGHGFVGSAVAAEAAQRGLSVRVVDKNDYAQAAGSSCDLLINANGNSRKYLAVKDPGQEFDLSVRTVKHSLVDFRAGLYIYLSSIDVYHPDTTDPRFNAETAELRTSRMSPYGFHKFLAEEIVRHDAPRWMVFRMGGFVGPGLWKNSIHDLLHGEPLRVHPDSRYQYLHTRDLAAIVLDLAAQGIAGEIFNIAGDGLMSLRDVAAQIPSARLPDNADALPSETYEVNIGKLKGLHAVPRTVDTVKAFLQERLKGG